MKPIRFILTLFLLVSVQLASQVPEGEIAVTASSTLPSSRTSNYSPDNLFDGTNASWCEGAKGSGVGEYIQVDFRYPDVLDYLMMKNGFGKEKYWSANARVQKMKVTNEEGESRIILLEDTPDLQVVGLNVIEESEDYLLEASGGLPGSSFTFEILEVYPGDRWEDLCLTELNFNQWYTEAFSMTKEYIYKNMYRLFFDGIIDQSGVLYIESDWDGYAEADIYSGYFYNEITSGDGTKGYDEYQVFINELTDQHYLFHSGIISYISQAGMEGKQDDTGKPERIRKNSWEFYFYNPENDKFEVVSDTGLNELFIVAPTAMFRDADGNSLTNKDISVSCIAPNVIAVSYPPYSEEQVEYMWDGNWFREMK